MSGRPLIEIGRVVAMLTDRMPALVQALGLRGRTEAGEYVALNPLRDDRNLGSFRINLRTGIWADFAIDVGGDALDLIAYIDFGGDKKRAFAWSKAWLGLDSTDPTTIEKVRRAEQRAAKRREEADREDARKRETGMRLWLAAQASILDTPVERYLAGRGIDLSVFEPRPSAALRFHPHLWNPESKRHWPAMVAAIVDRTGKTVAIHRTWLACLPDLRVVKAPLRDPKMTLGRYRGGSIRIWKGASKRPLNDAEPGSEVVITEGIEDALTVAMCRPELRVLAAVSLGNMGLIELPAAIATVTICADNDDGNPQAAAALDRAVERYLREGRRVRIARSPIGKDLNDALRAGGLQEGRVG